MASRKNMPERHQLRRERAARRFSTLSYPEFARIHGADTERYNAYVDRVQLAQVNLQRNIAAG